MDMLVLLTALFVRLNEPSARRDTRLRWHEEECAATRQTFGEIREFIRKGGTFGELPRLEQQKIQRVIFDRVK